MTSILSATENSLVNKEAKFIPDTVYEMVLFAYIYEHIYFVFKRCLHIIYDSVSISKIKKIVICYSLEIESSLISIEG